MDVASKAKMLSDVVMITQRIWPRYSYISTLLWPQLMKTVFLPVLYCRFSGKTVFTPSFVYQRVFLTTMLINIPANNHQRPLCKRSTICRYAPSPHPEKGGPWLCAPWHYCKAFLLPRPPLLGDRASQQGQCGMTAQNWGEKEFILVTLKPLLWLLPANSWWAVYI